MYPSLAWLFKVVKQLPTLLLSSALCAVLFIGQANAAYIGPGSQVSTTTVAAILKNPKEDMPVALKGHLVKKVKHETYLFSGGSGEIQVDIDDKDFPAGQHIDAKTKVDIVGEVDVDRKSGVEIDVKSLKVLQ